MPGLNRYEANNSVQPMSIRGREYVSVSQRVAAFWAMNPPEPAGIRTEFMCIDEQTAICRASVIVGGEVAATGTAYEERMSEEERAQIALEIAETTDPQRRKRLESALNAVNETSYIENCETSAIGRALGFYGIGSGASIASFEEVQQAMQKQQELEEKARRDAEAFEKELAAAAAAEHARALEEYRSALAQYAADFEKEEAEVLEAQEAHFGAPVDKWATELLRDVAGKFPRKKAE